MDIELPNLAIIPTDALILHENHDDNRAQPLVEQLTQGRVLRNPPVVSPLLDSSGRYAVLDGANRTKAIKLMGYPHILVQVVNLGQSNLSLKTWNHVLWNMAPADFLSRLRTVPNLTLNPSNRETAYQRLLSNQAVVAIQIREMGTLAAEIQPNDMKARVAMLNSIVDAYRDRALMDRSPVRGLEALEDRYPDLCALVIFPHFEIEDILRLSSQGIRLPTGITRFTISPRALRVNYPLEALLVDQNLETKNHHLQTWLQEKVTSRQVRYYAEETVLYDE